MPSETVHLSKEQETLLDVLYCRALDNRSKSPILHDETAEEIVHRLDYDFQKLRIQRDDILHAAIRAKQFDQWARDFLADHSDATVLHLACGLDSRIHRVAPSRNVRWVDLDYPEVIELRQRFYPPRDGYSMIGSSVTDPAFLDKVQTSGPVMIVAEGLFMYLAEHEVKELLQRLTSHFQNGQLAFDAWSSLTLRLWKYQSIAAVTDASLGWTIDDLRTIEQWVPRLQLVRELSWTEAFLSARISLGFRAIFGVMNHIPSMRRMVRFLLYRF